MSFRIMQRAYIIIKIDFIQQYDNDTCHKIQSKILNIIRLLINNTLMYTLQYYHDGEYETYAK